MTELVFALSVVFVTAGALLLVANHFGLSPIPFYIIAGLLAGGSGVIEERALIELAQWGIAFLVFVFAIRIDLGDVQTVLRDAEIAAATQLLVVGTLAVGVGYLFGVAFDFEYPLRNALYFGAAATLSSTLVGSGVLEVEIRNNLVHGRLASSIHFFDDVVAIAAILVLSADVLTDAQVVTSQIGYGVIFVLAGLLFYRHGFPLLYRIAEGNGELLLMGSISILIGFIAAAEVVGLSIVVGAFAAGIAIRAESARTLAVRNGIESIRDFFVAIFFVTLGALVQIPSIQALVLAAVLFVLVVLVNPLVHTLTFLYEGYDARTSFLASSSLNQVSELSLVIAIQAWLLGTISGDLFDAIILTAALTMILTVVTRRYEDFLYRTVVVRLFGGRHTRHVDEHSRVDDDLTDHVVIVGYGRQGRQLTRKLDALDVRSVAVENDPVLRADLRTNCRNYVFGDAMAEYPMQRARVEDARLVISTVDHRAVSETLLELSTDADLILRAGSSPEARELLDAGATFVAVPNVLAGDRLVENVERIVADEREAAALRDEHLEILRSLERGEFDTRFGRGSDSTR